MKCHAAAAALYGGTYLLWKHTAKANTDKAHTHEHTAAAAGMQTHMCVPTHSASSSNVHVSSHIWQQKCACNNTCMRHMCDAAACDMLMWHNSHVP